MPHRKSARMLISAALAATTTLTGPPFALAQQPHPLRLAQTEDPTPPDGGATRQEAPNGGDAPAPERSPQPEAEAGQPEASPERVQRQAPQAQQQADEPSAETESEAPRRQRSQVEPDGGLEATPPDVAEAAGKPEGPDAGAVELAPETPAVPPAEPTETAVPEEAPMPGQAPAGRATPAAPDASAPAATPAPAPTGEVPTAPNAVDPSASPTPNPATAPGAPDATTATPQNAPLPPASGNAARPVPPVETPTPNRAGTPEQAPPSASGGDAATGARVLGILPPPASEMRPQPVPADVQTAPVQPGRIDQSDARAQTLQQPVQVQPITRERGERFREEPRYELPPDAKVVRRDGDRQILSLGAAAVAGAVAGAAAGYFIRSNDDERLGVDASESYSERLPRGRIRETIVRPNGVQVVTITNWYGDVIQRSRVMPDGREVVLFYDPYSEDAQRPDYYEDPGRELPPVQVDIPEDEYVVDIDEPDEGIYYDTLVAPPVETVERIYSVDEVRRSKRIREKVRRIDLATVNFDFGSASIAQDQVPKLQALAEAVQRIVRDNPGESFLIEGHTDAVGSNEANLVLSDQRAEAVASALTRYFEVPAENLVTQGYGEQELKVDTQNENRENRRVTVRRVTALVKPIETSNR